MRRRSIFLLKMHHIGTPLKKLHVFSQTSGIFLHQLSRDHDLMAAAHTFEAEVRSYPQDLPLLTAAGMLFLQLYNIAHFVLHRVHLHKISDGCRFCFFSAVQILHCRSALSFPAFTDARRFPRSSPIPPDLHTYPAALQIY